MEGAVTDQTPGPEVVDVDNNGVVEPGQEDGVDNLEGVGTVLSPLSGAYLLIVLSEPISEEHKKKMLAKLRQGKSIDNCPDKSWTTLDKCH